MPELPEVETIKNAIKKSIGYSNIVKVNVNNNRLREKIPEDFAQTIENTKITNFQRIAKYIVIDLSNGQSIICHLGMSGRIKICDELPQPLAKHDHVIIETSTGFLIYNDARRFGLMTHCATKDLDQHHLFAKIGLDPFDESLNATYLLNKLKAKKIPIKVALLDQSIINGIGNIYASEALYTAGISPLRASCELSLKECEKLIVEVRKTLEKAINAGGSTLRDYQKPDGSLGYFQNMHCVYNKTGQQCPECTCNIQKTGGIQKVVQAGRSTFYCPTLQK